MGSPLENRRTNLRRQAATNGDCRGIGAQQKTYLESKKIESVFTKKFMIRPFFHRSITKPTIQPVLRMVHGIPHREGNSVSGPPLFTSLSKSNQVSEKAASWPGIKPEPWPSSLSTKSELQSRNLNTALARWCSLTYFWATLARDL